MNVPAVRPTDATVVLTLPPASPVVARPASPVENLSAAAKPVFEALQATAALPPSSNPGFVLPANGDFLRLFSAVSAIAAERIYPAPIFSFSA